ncbi:MAG: DUF3168 domain-containing protein [Alphaproteobacteria bacterium]|nr:DUF3168 domain-containing protein [Alphaproteobacteria bacterium]
MTAHALWDVQAAVHGVLAADTALTTQLASGANSVCDHVPQDHSFPYISFGEMRLTAEETQGFSGMETVMAIEAYSRAAGGKELEHILAAVHAALDDASFVVTGQTLVMCRHVDTAVSAPDGDVRRGTIRFRIVTEPSS